MARHPVEARAVEQDAAGARAQEPRDGAQHGGLAGAVGADHGERLALLDPEGDAAERGQVAVRDLHVLQLEEAHDGTSSPR